MQHQTLIQSVASPDALNPAARFRLPSIAILICFATLISSSIAAIQPASLLAGEYNSVLSTGDSMPAWSGLLGTDGNVHDSAAYRDQKVLLVVFTCNSCPYAVDLEDRLIELSKQHGPTSVAIVAINSNLFEEDLMPAMKERAEQKNFNFPYLFDESQKIAKSFGAKYTPECFVFNKKRELVYQGSMDDSPDGKRVAKRYVIDAIDAVLKGSQPDVEESVPIGCKIRFKRERRSRKK